MECWTLHVLNPRSSAYVVEEGSGLPGADAGWKKSFKMADDINVFSIRPHAVWFSSNIVFDVNLPSARKLLY